MVASLSSRGGSQSTSTYFRRPRASVMLLIVAAMGYYSWTVFAPVTVPYASLGPLGTFTKYLVENHNTALKIGYLISWLVHIGEALYSSKLCKDKGITNGITRLLWFVQTLAFGGFSLYYLLTYKPPRKGSEGFKQKTK